MSTLIFGVLLGWGIGAAAMKAAIAAREKVLLKSSLQKAQERFVQSCHIASQLHHVVQSAAGSANPDQVFKLDIFQGEFLDVRSVISLKTWYPHSPIPGHQSSLVSSSDSAHFSLLLSVLTSNHLYF
jgi:hypothetical protein